MSGKFIAKFCGATSSYHVIEPDGSLYCEAFNGGAAECIAAALNAHGAAKPVACTWPDCVTDGRCDVWCTSAQKAGVPKPAPAPAFDAADVALIDDVFAYVDAPIRKAAWLRLRAQMGVGK